VTLHFRDLSEVPGDVLQEWHEERRIAARRNHWCPECRGNTGPGSPCAPEEDDNEPEEDQS
jgi:hypothetical protein